jgi:hypothetical protein
MAVIDRALAAWAATLTLDTPKLPVPIDCTTRMGYAIPPTPDIIGDAR